MNNQDITNLKEKFLLGFSWNLSGSLFFEVLKTGHNILLISFLPISMYGAIGSLFSLIFLSSRLVDRGTTFTIPPFFHQFIKSKKNFKYLFFNMYLLPMLYTGIIISIIITAIYYLNFSKNIDLPYFFIPLLLIIFEAIRSFFRQFLHTTFRSKQTILSELIIFLFYLAIIWTCFFFFKLPITPNLIFILFLVDSIIALLFFVYFIKQFYRTLPEKPLAISENLIKRISSTKNFNFLLKISRDLFTSNFITPLFAYKFGLVEAGLFYFASTIAMSTQAIVKTAIGYTGSALLANLKESSLNKKRIAFNILCNKLAIIIVPIIIFLSINYSGIIKIGTSQNFVGITISLSYLYLAMSFSEFFFMLYEQFYIIEEATKTLFFFKLFEITLFAGVLLANQASSPVATLISIIIIRVISFSVISINAYFRWKIKPKFKINILYIIICLIFSFLYYAISH